MSLARYFLNIDDVVPARWLAVLERGAHVNGRQESVNTVTVHSPHEFAASDKFIYAETRGNIQNSRVFTVSSVTATTVVFSGNAASFPDKALLVNLGVDSGGVGVIPQYDAAAVAVYKDPQGSTAWTSSRVLVDPGGEVGFWGDGRTVWGVAVTPGGVGVRIYPDLGTEAGGSGALVEIAALPAASASWLGRHIIVTGAPSEEWVCLLDDDGVTPVWNFVA